MSYSRPSACSPITEASSGPGVTGYWRPHFWPIMRDNAFDLKWCLTEWKTTSISDAAVEPGRGFTDQASGAPRGRHDASKPEQHPKDKTNEEAPG